MEKKDKQDKWEEEEKAVVEVEREGLEVKVVEVVVQEDWRSRSRRGSMMRRRRS